MSDVLKRFLKYVKIDTPSDEKNAQNTPSTPCQFDLAKALCAELKELGLDARMTGFCCDSHHARFLRAGGDGNDTLVPPHRSAGACARPPLRTLHA